MIEPAFMYAPGVFVIPQTDGVDSDVARQYLGYLKQHIRGVQEAGRRIGVPEAQLDVHDKSKFSAVEFPAYAKHFYGGGAPNDFARAWLHHLHNNPHHWNHWLFSGSFAVPGADIVDGALPMPFQYVQEMAADWMGAQFAQDGTMDITAWFNKNASRMILHPQTWNMLADVLAKVGYSCRFMLREKQYEVKRG